VIEEKCCSEEEATKHKIDGVCTCRPVAYSTIGANKHTHSWCSIHGDKKIMGPKTNEHGLVID
jgi:hypothetical protein